MIARMLGPLIALATMMAVCTGAKAACSTDSIAADIGKWTTGQLNARAPNVVTVMGGMRCDANDLAEGSGARIVARIRSANGFEMRRAGGASIRYAASPDRTTADAMDRNGSIEYSNAALSGLATGSEQKAVGIPISFHGFHGVGLPSGTYSDVLTIEWRWTTCAQFDHAASTCRRHSHHSAETTHVMTMHVESRPPVVTMAVKTVHGDDRKRSTQTSTKPYRVMTVTVDNPDVVPIDADSIVLEVPVDQIMTASDHAGGISTVEVIRGAEDGMHVAYKGLDDASDDVECTVDGKDWTTRPVDPSQIRSVRIRVRGTLQPSKSVVVALFGSTA